MFYDILSELLGYFVKMTLHVFLGALSISLQLVILLVCKSFFLSLCKYCVFKCGYKFVLVFLPGTTFFLWHTSSFPFTIASRRYPVRSLYREDNTESIAQLFALIIQRS
jgi:hypothetical protein